jgi:hypothetical protein
MPVGNGGRSPEVSDVSFWGLTAMGSIHSKNCKVKPAEQFHTRPTEVRATVVVESAAFRSARKIGMRVLKLEGPIHHGADLNRRHGRFLPGALATMSSALLIHISGNLISMSHMWDGGKFKQIPFHRRKVEHCNDRFRVKSRKKPYRSSRSSP